MPSSCRVKLQAHRKKFAKGFSVLKKTLGWMRTRRCLHGGRGEADSHVTHLQGDGDAEAQDEQPACAGVLW